MPRGDKSSYTDKQKRQAAHIRKGYQKHGVSPAEAEARAWATVNKTTHGGRKSGSGRGTTSKKSPDPTGGRHVGRATASRSTTSARKTGSRNS